MQDKSMSDGNYFVRLFFSSLNEQNVSVSNLESAHDITTSFSLLALYSYSFDLFSYSQASDLKVVLPGLRGHRQIGSANTFPLTPSCSS